MANIKQLIEQLVKKQLSSLQEQEESLDPLYHVTYYNRLGSISNAGLKPRMARSIGAPGYDSHAQKGVFLTEKEGIKFWYSRAEDFANYNSDTPLEDGLVPVVLKIDPDGFDEEKILEDELGTKDSFNDAYIINDTISPDYIEVWDGTTWLSIQDWQDIDTTQAFDKEEIEGEDGEPEEYYLFKYNNPLEPSL
jgi:hypothetical protein